MKQNELLTARARELRSNSTESEKLIWYYLRNRRLGNHKFKRQVPIGNFIVDFLCEEKRLIIEIDGGQHADNINYDNKRTLFLESEGYKVIRFWNNEVLGQTEQVIEMIMLEIGAL